MEAISWDQEAYEAKIADLYRRFPAVPDLVKATAMTDTAGRV